MKRYLLLILIFNSSSLFSQVNFQPGLVVLTAGDTVKGFIDFKEWSTTPASISFKQKVDDENVTMYDSQAINYFEITGLEYYKLFTLPISMDEVDLHDLSIGRDTSRVRQTVFLKIIQQGKNLVLLSYKDKTKTRYFTIEHDKSPEELIFTRYYAIGNHSQMITINMFRNQLVAKAAKNNVSITSLIEKTNYDSRGILRVVSKINGIEPNKLRGTESNVPRSRFFVGGGISVGAAKFKGDKILGGNAFNGNPFDGFTSEISIKPMASAGLDFFLNPNIGKSILRLELSFHQFTNKMNLVEEMNGDYSLPRKSDISYSFTQNTFSFSPQYTYNFYNTSNFKWFAGGGFVVNLAAYPNGNVYDKRPQNPDYSYEAVHDDNYYDLDKFCYSGTVSSGIVLNKKYEIGIKYSFPYSISSTYQGFTLKTTFAQLGIRYLFNRSAKN